MTPKLERKKQIKGNKLKKTYSGHADKALGTHCARSAGLKHKKTKMKR